MKLVIAMMQHETNTFSPLATPYAAFGRAIGSEEPPVGDAVVDTFRGTDMAIGAFLDLAEQRSADIVVPIAAYAEPSGRVLDSAFERIAGRICAAVAEGCDAVLLDLHGAMVTESYDDGEGELLRRIRERAPDVPRQTEFSPNLMGFAALHPSSEDWRTRPVGWVQRSETHHPT